MKLRIPRRIKVEEESSESESENPADVVSSTDEQAKDKDIVVTSSKTIMVSVTFNKNGEIASARRDRLQV